MTMSKVGLDDFLLTHTVEEFWALPEEESGTEPHNWSDPAPLGDELPPVESLDMNLLPPSLRPLAEDISEQMQAPPDLVAAAIIVSLAGCVNRRARVQPKIEDTGWEVTLNLWGAMIAPPGFMKSPILRAVTAPHGHIEEMWRAEHDSAIAEFESEKEKKELEWQAWREEFKRALKKKQPTPVEPDTSLRAPVQRRLVLTDATFEKLHEILVDNPAGVLIIRDELTGLLAGLDRQGREGERGFLLQAWNGDGGFSIDRIGRGSVYVAAVCVSLLGCIQPTRLRWYLWQALEGGPADDGLLQRFQFVVWPDPSCEWKLIDRPPNKAALACAEKVFSRLANLSADSPLLLRFDPDAQRLFFAWWGELERKIRGAGSCLHPALISHLSKYRSLMPKLSGLFELADRIAADDELVSPLSISLAHEQQAAAFCDYLESHAKRVYSCLTTPELHAARELAKHIERGDLAKTFTTREVYFANHWSGLDTPERVRRALVELEAAGWVRRVRAEVTAGRPQESWQVNPKVVVRAK